jgi:CheY-like chemotaxis protein
MSWNGLSLFFRRLFQLIESIKLHQIADLRDDALRSLAKNLPFKPVKLFFKMDVLATQIIIFFLHLIYIGALHYCLRDALKEEQKKKVIVVDGDEDILTLLTYEFRSIGFDVKSFKTGTEALNFLLDEKNIKDEALVILDRMLPDMDGLDILREFTKKFPRQIPVLIFCILNSEKDVMAGLQTGAIDYITKPFSVFKLMQKATNCQIVRESAVNNIKKFNFYHLR